jgi:hypothetical protein
MGLHQPLPERRKYVESGFVQEEPAYPAITAAAGAGMLVASGMYLFAQLQKGKQD